MPIAVCCFGRGHSTVSGRPAHGRTARLLGFFNWLWRFHLGRGTAPNRIFYIEWRTSYIDRPGTADFEVALYENNSSFYDVLYNCRYGQRGSKWGAGEQLRRPGYDLLVSGAYACERIESHLHLHRGDAYADSNTNTKTSTDAATSPDSVGVKVSDP